MEKGEKERWRKKRKNTWRRKVNRKRVERDK